MKTEKIATAALVVVIFAVLAYVLFTQPAGAYLFLG
jgi:hypothetical protein